MPKRFFQLTENEEPIIGRFEHRLVKSGVRISREMSRHIFEEARKELLDRARERCDWDLIGKLYNPEPGSRAEALLESHMRTLYEETHGELPELEDEEEEELL